MAQPVKITYSPEISALLSLAHSIARLKRQISTYDNKNFKDYRDYRDARGKEKAVFVHTDAQLRAQRRNIENKIVSILKPLKYPRKAGWVKYIETSSEGHDILQKSDIQKLVDTMREIEQGYWTIIHSYKEVRELKSINNYLRKECDSACDKLRSSYKRASSAASMLSRGYDGYGGYGYDSDYRY